MPNNNSTIDYLIGLPPQCTTDETISGRTQTVMEQSMPIAKIYPGVPTFTKGTSLFTRAPAFRSEGGNKKSLSYSSILESHGFRLAQPKYTSNSGNEGCIAIAYQADSFPTDSFTNDYGENFLQGLTNIASEAAASLAQMRGARDVGQLFRQTTGALKDQGGLIGAGGELIDKAGSAGAATLRALLPKSVMGGIDVVSRLAAGSRLDFPMVWKTSSFQPSYTMTVRLYNPMPGNKDATIKYIAAPIAALMLLAIPISADGVTYSWPFIHKIVSPGIYNLDPAFISNITIIKGGDQQQIGQNQALGVVDVRIDFGSLFSSMLAAKGTGKTRPTLQTYLDAMVGPDSSKPVQNFSTSPRTPLEEQLQITNRRRQQEQLAITRNQSPTEDTLTDEEKDNPPDRVSTTTRATSSDLLSRMPEGFRQTFGGGR